MKLIIGLGNPGAEYTGTRHNFGFMAIDNYANTIGANWQNKAKFNALVAEANVQGERVLLVKPLTFYNLVGESAQKISAFYKIPIENILAIHDEMALPLGTVRTRIGGSDAGNNGIKNLINIVGANFARIRIGSGMPPSHDGDAQPTHDRRDYVLNRLNRSDQVKFETELGEVTKFINDFIVGRFQQTTFKLR